MILARKLLLLLSYAGRGTELTKTAVMRTYRTETAGRSGCPSPETRNVTIGEGMIIESVIAEELLSL